MLLKPEAIEAVSAQAIMNRVKSGHLSRVKTIESIQRISPLVAACTTGLQKGRQRPGKSKDFM